MQKKVVPEEKMFRRFFHVNVCVRDMAHSIRFYEDMGFKKAQGFILGSGKPNIGEALGVEVKKLRGVFMRLGDDPSAPVLDLVQFLDPPLQGEPYPTLNHLGICRIAFVIDDIDKAYATLKDKGSNLLRRYSVTTGPTEARSESCASETRMERSSRR